MSAHAGIRERLSTFLDDINWTDEARMTMRQIVDQQLADIRDAGLDEREQAVTVMAEVAMTAVDFPPVLQAQQRLILMGELDTARMFPIMFAHAVVMEAL